MPADEAIKNGMCEDPFIALTASSSSSLYAAYAYGAPDAGNFPLLPSYGMV